VVICVMGCPSLSVGVSELLMVHCTTPVRR